VKSIPKKQDFMLLYKPISKGGDYLMKIFIGENRSCVLNYQHDLIFNELSFKYEITDDPKDADIIIFAGTCCCTEYNIINTISYMSDVLQYKKENAKVYMTGCMTREFNENKKLNGIKSWIKKNIDVVVPQNQSNLLLKLISNSEFCDLDSDDFGLAARCGEKEVVAYISNGCLNNCSFCKTTFQKYPLKSVSLEDVKSIIDKVDESKASKLILTGTNICQFGLDTCGRHLLPELLEYIENKENINSISLNGFSFKDAIHNDFQNVLASSQKRYRLCGSLESGSNRLLDLIRKGFTSEEIIEFVENIRKRNEIELYLNIISGFPTETLEDVKLTLDVLKKLSPTDVDICRYTNSSFIDSSQYEQLTPEKIQEHTRIYNNVLVRRKVKTLVKGSGYKYN